MRVSPRNKLIAVGVGAVVVVALLITVLVVPQFGRLGTLGAQMKSASDGSDAAKTLLDQRREVKNRASITNSALIQLANAVPENPELPSLIIELQDTAYASDVSLRSVAPQVPTQDEGAEFIRVPLQMTAWGTWADTVDFIQRLRRLGRQVRIVDFESTLLEEGTAVEAAIDLPPYYQVATILSIETYVIPGGSIAATVVPAPAGQAGTAVGE